MKLKVIAIFSLAFFLLSFTDKSFTKVRHERYRYTNLVIVRHAEKNNETDTSTLSPIGLDRANRLAQFLVYTKLNGIYTTPFPRMYLTAQPTAAQHNLEIKDYKPNDLNEIDVIVQSNSMKTVLLVGHSNTIPQILNHYTQGNFETLTDYNDIFVLQVSNRTLSVISLMHFYY